VFLGACESGLEAVHAAEQVDGFASLLLLKGVQGVFASPGMQPVPVLLIEAVTAAIAEAVSTSATLGRVIQKVREAQLGLRKWLQEDSDSYEIHPLQWAGITFYGIPWRGRHGQDPSSPATR
jgi:hypothetical protein